MIPTYLNRTVFKSRIFQAYKTKLLNYEEQFKVENLIWKNRELHWTDRKRILKGFKIHMTN